MTVEPASDGRLRPASDAGTGDAPQPDWNQPVGWIQPARALAAPISRSATRSVEVRTTTRHGGNSRAPWHGFNLGDHVGDDPAHVAANRALLRQMLDGREVQWLKQVHGRDCVRVRAGATHEVPVADAAWTDAPDVALAVLTADCVPVVLAAPDAGVVAVAHAGWRGLVGGVLEALLAAAPVPAHQWVAWLGPAIGPALYQVDAPVVRAILACADGAALVDRAVRADDVADRWRLDLFALAEALLVRGGVGDVRCERLCTASDPRWFSHRAAVIRDGPDARTGRFATLVWQTCD
jgi:YfiH family protein